jgi:uncharacterized protein (TIGR03032 family)
MSLGTQLGSPAPTSQPLRSRHTSNFPALLDQLGVSILVTTYQAGKLVLLRSDGGKVNTHFRDLPRPMGLAADRTRLAVGTAQEIRHYRNLAPVCRRLEPPGRHDACYLFRSAHVTGDIDIHEMVWVPLNPTVPEKGRRDEGELWFVNTRFSCLCTLSGVHSFVPRWRPPFVTALAPEDRCHLNGLGLAPDDDGKLSVRYVTALSATDTPQGWRANKKDGGVVVEVPSGAVIARGLSMPHSPRWMHDQLWVLESGKGGLGVLNLSSGRYECLAELPGFTRGLDFYGHLAFVGLSQVRESAVFSGIPIAERALAERNCGVWVVDIRTGQTVAFLRFEEAVQEVFAVQVLPGLRYPEIAPDDHKLLADSYDLPTEALRQVPPILRRAAEPGATRGGEHAAGEQREPAD